MMYKHTCNNDPCVCDSIPVRVGATAKFVDVLDMAGREDELDAEVGCAAERA